VFTMSAMGCRGVLFAITEDQARRLRAARGGDAAVLSIVQDEIEEAWDQAHLCQTDKAWDAIHRCLTDGTLVPQRAKRALGAPVDSPSRQARGGSLCQIYFFTFKRIFVSSGRWRICLKISTLTPKPSRGLPAQRLPSSYLPRE
jgi:hypothetical protein